MTLTDALSTPSRQHFPRPALTAQLQPALAATGGEKATERQARAGSRASRGLPAHAAASSPGAGARPASAEPSTGRKRAQAARTALRRAAAPKHEQLPRTPTRGTSPPCSAGCCWRPEHRTPGPVLPSQSHSAEEPAARLSSGASPYLPEGAGAEHFCHSKPPGGSDLRCAPAGGGVQGSWWR